MYGYIYKITNILDNKIYIGKHKSKIFDESYWGSGIVIRNIIAKHGTKNLKREILEQCEDLKQLNEAEKYWISTLNANNSSIGYNRTTGGDGGSLVSGYTWYNNNLVEIYINPNDPIPEGFIKGRLIDNNHVEGFIWINNGKIQHIIDPKDFDKYPGFTYGMLDRGDSWRQNVGKYTRTEEIINKQKINHKKFFKDNPDFRNAGNFKPGVPSHNKGKRSITNGIKNHYITVDEFPFWKQQGWYWGNTQVRKPKEVNIND